MAAKRAEMNRGTRGGFWSSALILILLMVGFMGAGYAIGRYVIGERYVKRGAVAIRTQQRPRPTYSGFVPLPSASDAWRFNSPESYSEEWLPEDQGGARATVEEISIDVVRESEQEAVTGEDADLHAAETYPPGDLRYAIQVGVFLDEKNSQALIDDLNNRGYSARVERVEDSHGTIYRVITGDFHSEQSAGRAAERLMNEGYTGAFVTRTTEGGGDSDESASEHSESR